MCIVLWSLDSHFHLWWNIVQFWTIFVLTFVESVNNIVNRIVFISTATCKNKWRNSPLFTGIHQRCTKGLSFAYSHCPMSQTRSNDVAIPAASLCLLGKITVKSTPWGKVFLRNHPCFAASALKASASLDGSSNPAVHREKKEIASLRSMGRRRQYLSSSAEQTPGSSAVSTVILGTDALPVALTGSGTDLSERWLRGQVEMWFLWSSGAVKTPLVKRLNAFKKKKKKRKAHSLQLLSHATLGNRESGERKAHSRSSQEWPRSSASKQTLDGMAYNDLPCCSLVLLKDKSTGR